MTFVFWEKDLILTSLLSLVVQRSLRTKGGRYFVDYRINGRRVRKAVGKSKKIAELALKDIEVKIERDEIGFEEKDGELKKLFEEFTAYGKSLLLAYDKECVSWSVFDKYSP